MNDSRVSKHFKMEASEYDGLIPKIIPKYHEQNELIIKLLPLNPSNALKVLDLGCGTGVLSSLVLSAFPKATVVAFDLTAKMLHVCQENLRASRDRFFLQQGDFACDDFGGGYDLVISGLSIHHLDAEGKQLLFKKIFAALNPEGIFLNRDVILGSSESITEQYYKLWRDFMKNNNEDEAKWFKRHLEEDIPSSIDNQLTWLREAGFEDVGCHWQYLNFAIFGGRKPRDILSLLPLD